jgi:hypothetical protein
LSEVANRVDAATGTAHEERRLAMGNVVSASMSLGAVVTHQSPTEWIAAHPDASCDAVHRQ